MEYERTYFTTPTRKIKPRTDTLTNPRTYAQIQSSETKCPKCGFPIYKTKTTWHCANDTCPYKEYVLWAFGKMIETK